MYHVPYTMYDVHVLVPQPPGPGGCEVAWGGVSGDAESGAGIVLYGIA